MTLKYFVVVALIKPAGRVGVTVGVTVRVTVGVTVFVGVIEGVIDGVIEIVGVLVGRGVGISYGLYSLFFMTILPLIELCTAHWYIISSGVSPLGVNIITPLLIDPVEG
jgi:hypothetical protein